MSSTYAPVEYGTCPECGYLLLPILPMLPCGHAVDVLRAPLDQPGTVYSWTRVETGNGATVIAMADFFDGQLRVTTPMEGSSGVAIGDQVHVISGTETPYVFVPVLASPD